MWDILIWAFSGLGITLVGLAFRYHRHIYGWFRKDSRYGQCEDITDDVDHKIEELGSYHLDHANYSDILWISNTAKELYGENAAPTNIKQSWFRKMPLGFWIIKNSKGSPVGSFEMITVKKKVIEQMTKGLIGELDIKRNDILPPDNLQNTTFLYVMNIMAVHEDFTPIMTAIRECLTSVPKIINDLNISSHKTEAYAMPLREFKTRKGKLHSPGEKLLRKLGFVKILETTKQGYPLYKAKVSDVISNLSSFVRPIDISIKSD